MILKKIIPSFLHQFTVVFHDDWEQTKQKMGLKEDADFFAYYGNWGNHELLVEAYRQLVDKIDVLIFFKFIKYFEQVFHRDWDYTKDMLWVSTKDEESFICTKDKTWTNRNKLIELYKYIVINAEFLEMELAVAARLVEKVEADLEKKSMVELEFLTAGSAMVQIFLTQELQQKCIENNLWKSKAFYETLNQLRYGLDENSFSFDGENGMSSLNEKYHPIVDIDIHDFDLKSYQHDVEKTEIISISKNKFVLLGIHNYKSYLNTIILVDFQKEK